MVGGRTILYQSHLPVVVSLLQTGYDIDSVAYVHGSGRGETELGLESLVGDAVFGAGDEMCELDRLVAFVNELLDQLDPHKPISWYGQVDDSRSGTSCV